MVNKALPGEQLKPDGTLHNGAVIGGLASLGAGVGATFLGGGPATGSAVGKLGGKLTDYFTNGGQGQFAPSPFGPYQSGYQAPTQPSQPSVSGLPGNDMGYATLPNYG